MALVDFYILDSTRKQSSWLFACKLAEEAYSNNKKTIILMDNKEDAIKLDKLMWTFKDNSFIPHELGLTDAPICISTTLDSTTKAQQLINLSAAVAPENTFNNIIEILTSDPQDKANGRERYRHYRTLSYTLNSHQVQMANL